MEIEIIHVTKMIQREIDYHINKIGKELKSDIFYWHGELSLANAKTYFIDKLKLVKQRGNKGDRITIMLTTNGGDHEATSYIIDEIRNKLKYKEIYVIVSTYAKSAGTIFCFYADKLYLNGHLGTIDIQIPTQLISGEIIQVSASAIISDYDALIKRHEGHDDPLTKFEENLISEKGLYKKNYINYLKDIQIQIERSVSDKLIDNHKYKVGVDDDKIDKLKQNIHGLCYPYDTSIPSNSCI